MTSVMTTAVRVAVTLLAIAGMAGHVAYLDTLWWHSLDLVETAARDASPPLVLLLGAHAVVSVVSGVFAVALVLHEGRHESAARGLGVALGAWSYLMAYSGVTMLFRPAPGAVQELFEGHFLLVEMIGLAGLLRFTALFPQPLDPSGVEPPPGLPAVFEPAHAVSVFMLRPWAPWVVGLVILVALWSGMLFSDAAVADAGLSPIMDVVRLAAAGLVVLNLRRAWTRADGAGRERLLWLAVSLALLLGAVAVMIGGNVLVAVTGLPEPALAWRPLLLDLGLIGFLTALALSVLYQGEVRPGAVLRRVAIASSVVTLGLFLAAGLEALLSGGIVVAFALRTGVGSALAFATMVSTYRAFVRAVDRMLPQP